MNLTRRSIGFLGLLVVIFIILLFFLTLIDPSLFRLTGTALHLVEVTCEEVDDVSQLECESLKALYQSTNGPEWYRSDNWLYTKGVCSWYGVVCEANQVVSLDLSGNRLDGTVPAELASLTYLEGLFLSGNQLHGAIPSELSNLENLYHLVLGYNKFSGSVPSELGDLENLLSLDLHVNLLSGSLPSSLGGLKDLQRLYLDHNQFDGTIPPALGELEDLLELRLQVNRLGGTIPPELSNLTNLLELSIGDNQLGGGIPTGLGGLTSLQRLYMSNNDLNGSLPIELGELGNLQEINLEHNQLSGTIPSELGELRSISYLNLKYNQLSGGIPSQLGQLGNLRQLILCGNKLEGELPFEIGDLVDIATLDIGENALQGEIPASFINLEASGADLWNYVNLGYNGLTSSDPEVIAFLQTKDWDWVNTQTVPPSNLLAVFTGSGIMLSWTPIAYTVDGGYYEVSLSDNPDGPYVVHGYTADKSIGSYFVDDLADNKAYFFRLRTFTPTHGNQQNDLWSDYATTSVTTDIWKSPIRSTYFPLVIR